MILKYSPTPILNYEWLSYNSLLEETEDGAFKTDRSAVSVIYLIQGKLLFHNGGRRETLYPSSWTGALFQRINEPLPLSGTKFNPTLPNERPFIVP